jgi:hypothetical protein
MVELRQELTIEDLISITTAIRYLRPELKESVCVGVEVPQVGDKSIVFHMRGPEIDDRREENIVMISADLILEKFGGTGNVAERNV